MKSLSNWRYRRVYKFDCTKIKQPNSFLLMCASKKDIIAIFSYEINVFHMIIVIFHIPCRICMLWSSLFTSHHITINLWLTIYFIQSWSSYICLLCLSYKLYHSYSCIIIFKRYFQTKLCLRNISTKNNYSPPWTKMIN